MPDDLIYSETFADGNGSWSAGKDKEDGSFNRNIFGHKGDRIPLGWDPEGGRSGGCAYTESPWYFDSNHGEFMWFYMVLLGPNPHGEAWGAVRTQDIRDAVVSVGLRGRDVQLRGTRLYLWVQGNRGPHIREIYNPGDPLVNWALTSQPIGDELVDGAWHDFELTLHSDESQWSQMGLLNRGLPRKIIVEQSLSFATGTLDRMLNGSHYGLGFLLGGVDPNDPPTGRIDIDRIEIKRGS